MANENLPENKRPETKAGGAEAYPNKTKGAFPWWFPVLLLLPILALIGYSLRSHEPAPTETALPATTAFVKATDKPAVPVAADATPTAAPAATDGADKMGAKPDDKTGDKKVHSGSDIAVGATGAASPAGEPLTNVVDLTSAADKTAFIGRKAKLTDVNVTKVLTDRAFFVGTTDNQQMLILLDAAMDAGPNGERVPIATGKPVSLTGLIEKTPKQEILSEQYKLSGANYDAVSKEPVYLHATVAQKK